MGLINIGAGFSALGQSVANTAGDMALAQQKSMLENQRMQLADQLVGARERTARVESGVPQDVALKDLSLKESKARYNLLYGNDGPAPAVSDQSSASAPSPAPSSAGDAVTPAVTTAPAQSGILKGGIPSSILPPSLTPEAARYMQIVDPAGFRELVNKWLAPSETRQGNTITYRDPVTHEQVEAYRNINQAKPFTAEDRAKFGLPSDAKGYTDENGKPVVISGREPLVQLADGTYTTRENAVGKKGPLSTSRMGDDGTKVDDPIVQSHVKNVLNGNETMQNVPPQFRNSVSMAIANSPKDEFSPIAKQRETLAASRILQNYIKSPQYELTMNGLPYLQRIDAASKNPSSVSDLDLLDSMIKLNTAGNAVTEQQVKTITDGKSWFDAVGVAFNKVRQGGVLSGAQRREIHELAGSIYDNYRKGFQPLYDEATQKLRDADIPPQFWSLPDFNKLSNQALAGTSYGVKQFPAPPPAAVQDLKSGKGSAAQFDEVFGPGAAEKVTGGPK